MEAKCQEAAKQNTSLQTQLAERAKKEKELTDQLSKARDTILSLERGAKMGEQQQKKLRDEVAKLQAADKAAKAGADACEARLQQANDTTRKLLEQVHPPQQ